VRARIRNGAIVASAIALFLPLLLLPVLGALATNPPSTCSGAWTNPTYAYADDTNRASSGTGAQVESYSGYGFSIPTEATVSKVRVRLDAYCSATSESIGLYVSNDGGSTWGSMHTQALTASEVTYWIDVTADRTWTPATINNDKIWTRVQEVKVGAQGTDYLDWIPVEVTYSSQLTREVTLSLTVTMTPSRLETLAREAILPATFEFSASRTTNLKREATMDLTSIFVPSVEKIVERSVSFSLTLVSSAERLGDYIRDATFGAAVSLVPSRVLTLVRFSDMPLSFNFASSSMKIIERTVSFAMGATFTNERILSLSRESSLGLGILFTPSRGVAFSRTANLPQTFTFDASRSLALVREVSFSLVTSLLSGSVRTLERSASLTIGIFDYVGRSLGLARSVSFAFTYLGDSTRQLWLVRGWSFHLSGGFLPVGLTIPGPTTLPPPPSPAWWYPKVPNENEPSTPNYPNPEISNETLPAAGLLSFLIMVVPLVKGLFAGRRAP